MIRVRGSVYGRVGGWVDGWVDGWCSGTRRSQLVVLLVLLALVLVSFGLSLHEYTAFPIAGYFVWLLLGRLLLRYQELLVLVTATFVTATVSRFRDGAAPGGRVTAEIALVVCCALVVYAASRHRGSLPGPLSEALLADLRRRLTAQGQVPPLPGGWTLETAMVSAFGVGYAGDFMVADVDHDEQRLDLVLVDVVGKGVKAAPAALLFAGALGGLVGALRGDDLLDAANDFLLRQAGDESFATAVHVSIDLADGDYEIRSAGHPPALRWNREAREWEVDGARGLALGVLPHPDTETSAGRLAPGEALMFYTDGVVESPTSDIDDGIDWLRATARLAVLSGGFAGAADRVVGQVARGDDDRALLVLARPATSSPATSAPSDPSASSPNVSS